MNYNFGGLRFQRIYFLVFSAEIYFRWCALPGEKTKCDDFMKHVNMTAQNMSLAVKTSCVDGTDPDDCMEKIKNSEADLVTLSGGDTYSAGKLKLDLPGW